MKDEVNSSRSEISRRREGRFPLIENFPGTRKASEHERMCQMCHRMSNVSQINVKCVHSRTLTVLFRSEERRMEFNSST